MKIKVVTHEGLTLKAEITVIGTDEEKQPSSVDLLFEEGFILRSFYKDVIQGVPFWFECFEDGCWRKQPYEFYDLESSARF